MGGIADVSVLLWGSLVQAAWVGVRVTAFMATVPVFGSRVVPRRIRLLFAVALTPIIAGVLPPVVPPPAFSADWWLGLVFNVSVGLLLGVLLQLLFEALMLAAELISAVAGLSFAQVNDPLRGTASPVLGSMLMAFASLFFLALNGHHILLRLLVMSYDALPATQLPSVLPWQAATALVVPMLQASLSLALPVLASLLVVQLGFGLVSRAAPALNLFAIGLPAALMALLLLLWLWLPQLGDPLAIYWSEMAERFGGLLSQGATP